MLTPEEIEHIARLARLALTPEERARFAQQLSVVLDHAAALMEIDVEGIPPTATVLPVHSVMRADDTPMPGLTREEALRNAPQTDGEFFIVPATFGDEA